MVRWSKEEYTKSTIVGEADGARYGDKGFFLIDGCYLAVDAH
jgi:hypothetical protein